jgi:polysaccharide chain length determinant protein (PEP-CTERM system associated)
MFDQYLQYLRVIWDHRWLALGTAAVMCLLGWSLIITAPDKYRVSARVYLDTRSMLKPLLHGLAVEDVGTEHAVFTVQRTMLTRPNLESVANSAGLVDEDTTPEELESLIGSLQNKIEIKGDSNENIFLIAYQSRDPLIAKRVVESLLNLFLERVYGETRSDSDVTERFLGEQIADYEQRLEAAEQRLKDFKTKHAGLTPEDDKNYFSKLSLVERQLAEAELQLKETVNRRDALRQQMARTPATIPAGIIQPGLRGTPATSLDAKIAELRGKLAEMELQFTEEHPDIAHTRSMIVQLEKRREVELAALESGQASQQIPQAYVQNPQYQNLSMQLAEAEGNVVSFQTRVVEYRKRLEDLQSLVDTMPAIEAEYQKLNRDYDVTYENYNKLLQRRDSAEISKEAETADELKLEIIEPPRIPALPAGPNRLKWMGVVLLLGLVSAVGVAFVIGQSKAKIYDRRGLKEFTDIPILGEIPIVITIKRRMASAVEKMIFSAGVCSLLGIYALLAVLIVNQSQIIKQLAGLSPISI